jgi:hypothetical protein
MDFLARGTVFMVRGHIGLMQTTKIPFSTKDNGGDQLNILSRTFSQESTLKKWKYR